MASRQYAVMGSLGAVFINDMADRQFAVAPGLFLNETITPPAPAAELTGRRRRGRRRTRIWTEEQLRQPDPLAPPQAIDQPVDTREADHRLERIATLEGRLATAETLTRSLRRSMAAELKRLRDEEDDEEAAVLLLS